MITLLTLFVIQGVVGSFLCIFRGWTVREMAERSVFWAFFYSAWLICCVLGIFLLIINILP